MAKAELLVQYSSSPAFSSAVIRRLCHSRFSHVDVVLPGEGLLGASGPDTYDVRGAKVIDPGGVRIRPFDPWPYLDKPRVARIVADEEKVRLTIEAWRSQIGKPFDGSALWGFLADAADAVMQHEKRDWRDVDKWFCSEGVIWSCEQGGLFPWPLVVVKNRVTPADSLLLFNSMMPEENIREFLE